MTRGYVSLVLGLIAAIALISAASAKPRKVIAAGKLYVPEVSIEPQPARDVWTISGRLGIRACFTSAFSDGRKIKCPGRVVNECTVGRAIAVRSEFGYSGKVTTAAGGRFSVEVPHYPGDYQEAVLHVDTRRVQAGGFKISCYGASEYPTISPPPSG